jgi:hypothetical protein
VARDCFVPLVEAVMPPAGKTVLEYGSGGGAVTTAFMPGTARYIGIDIDEDAVHTAQGFLAEGDLHPELIVAPPERVLEEPARFRDEIEAPVRPSAAGTWHAELTLPAPAQLIELYLSRAATVGFVLYGA